MFLADDKRLRSIDLASGATSHYLQLPQAAALGPIVDLAHGMIYVVAEQSNLYVITSRTMLQQVVHLGHDKGTIVAAPTVVGDFLLVPVNGGDEASVRVLSIDAKDAEPLSVVQKIKIKGYVNTPPAAISDGAVVVTAQGGMVALAADAAGGDSPFRIAAHTDTALDEKAVHLRCS